LVRQPRSAKSVVGLARQSLEFGGSVRYRRKIKDFQKLDVWQAARALATSVYVETRTFPRSERFGLVGQMRRAAVSIASNTAEGSQRLSDAEFARFVAFARGSAAELSTQLTISRDVGLMSGEASDVLLSDVERVRMMLQRLHLRLSANRE
jgi:four helix bundle protein